MNVSATELFKQDDAGDSHDVFFLDVEMPKVDGFQLADKIRNKLPAAIIVFLTSHSELAPDGYKFRALRYVSKLVLSQKLPEALEAVQKEFSALESGYLVVPHYTDALRIPYNEILYVQHILRSSQIYTLRQGVIKDIRQYAVWAQMGDSTLEQRYNLFLERREAVMAQIKELEDQLKVIDYKCKYYEEAIAAGTEDIHKHKTGHCYDDEKENKEIM